MPRDFTLPVPLFSPGAAWNQTVVSAAALPESDWQILVTYRVLRGDTSSLRPPEDPPLTEWPFMDVNYDEYSIPISRAGTGRHEVVICADDGVLGWPHPKFGIARLGGPVPVPAPAGRVRPSGPQSADADGHLVLYDVRTFTAFDFFAAIVEGGGDCRGFRGGKTGKRVTEAGVVDFFDVRGDGANADTFYSARATGPPLLAGLILPEDVERGSITHGLAFAIPGPRNTSADPYEPAKSDYFYPASTTETDYFNTDPHSLAAGQRIRLKRVIVDEEGETIDESELAPVTRLFLSALRTHGAYLVDSAAGFSFYAEDIHTANLRLSDGEVNALAGRLPGAALPPGKTRWELVIEALNDDLTLIPFAYGPWREGQDPATALIDYANFEVVEPASVPAPVTVTPTVTPTATAHARSTAWATTTLSPTPSPSTTASPPPTTPPSPGAPPSPQARTATPPDTPLPQAWLYVPFAATGRLAP